MPAPRLGGWLDGFTERHGPTEAIAGADEVVLTGADGARAWIAVPFPPLAPIAAGLGPRAALTEHVTRRRVVGVLLVRRGGHAAAVFDRDDLIASKTGSGYVQGTTRAGGWSQKRFARRRDNQAKAAFAGAADIAVQILLPHLEQLEAVVCGGDRAAVLAALADARLAPLAALRRDPFLAVPDPRLRVLRTTPEQFQAVRITLDP